MKEWVLQVKVDTNDGDYLTDEHVVDSPDFLSPYSELISAIKERHGRYNKTEYARDGEDYYSVYVEQLGFSPDLIEEFGDLFPYGENGFHSIVSIKIVQREIFETITYI